MTSTLSAFGDQTFGDANTAVNITVTGKFTDGANADGRQQAMSTILLAKGWRLNGLSVYNDGSFAASVIGSTTDNLATVASTFQSQDNNESPVPITSVTASFGLVNDALSGLTGELDKVTAWAKQNETTLILGGALLAILLLRRH